MIDQSFAGLPLAGVADAALSAARASGASHAEVRVERTRSMSLRVRDHDLDGAGEAVGAGLSVRVLLNGTWGFAATTDLSPDGAAASAASALEVARVSAPLNTERVELSPEPVHQAEWASDYEVNPFEVESSTQVDLLRSWTERLLADRRVAHADADVLAVQENKFYADLDGTATTQQRVRIHPSVTAVAVDPVTGAFDSMRTVAPPVGRGWEYLLGRGWDWDSELDTMPELLAEKMVAPALHAGPYDMVIDPTNLWLTIHESIGHATELDRALGYEAAYAGTSFATFDQLGRLVYGSPIMHVTGDRTVDHGLATVGFDDEGVEGQSWDLIRDGILVGYQLNRAMAARQDLGRSNGCAYADSPAHVPLQRMANVSLQPSPGGPTTDALIAGVEDGIYVVGDRSWSIDMQRYNFQFTGQRFYRIRAGRLVGQLRDLAYQGTTTDFWRSMEAVGGEDTYLLCGAFNCGKGQPAQVAAVSHGCPSALFRQVQILNTSAEGGR